LVSLTLLPTTAYHPQSNGLVERFHRRLKDALRSRAAAADWHDHLPWVLLGIRTAFQEDSEFSPAEAVYGSQLVLPGQFINTAESPSLSFLRELQTMMTGRPPPPARHNAAPAPASKAAAQGSPRCAGATCPRAAAETAGAAASGDLQPSSHDATNNYVHFFSIRLPSSHRPAAEPTQPLSLLLCFPP
jgi:hypothetical protein